MKKITALAAIAILTTACASAPTPVSSSRDAYLAERAELPAEQGVDCGQPGGKCTVHFHASPLPHPKLKVGATEFPLELPKLDHLSSR